MKLSTILFFVSILQVSAGDLFSQSARISLNMQDASLETVFNKIEEQTSYRFLYWNESIRNKQVSLTAENKDVETILNEVLPGAGVDFRILQENLVVITPAENKAMQQLSVSGQVIDIKTREPLPGVNIIEKGTMNGTVTDVQGNFRINVKGSDAVLVFSFIGYDIQEVPLAGRTNLNVELVETARELDEVIVVGYGTMKKSDLTGAVSSINEEQLRQTQITSIDQALQGRAAGVQVFQNSGQPGGGVSIRIRGANSINGTSEPLYVIDGVPVSGDASGTAMGWDWAGGGNGQTAVSALSTINPSDIVSIEILKDASAQAIYGSRAANGVVLITTKRGNSGQSKLSYEGYYGLQTVSKYLDIMNLPEYADYSNDMANDGWITQREEFLDPSLLPAGTDWQREVFQAAPMASHQLSVTGGNDKTTYAISGGYFSQDGIVIGSWFDRYSLRLNIDTQAKDWLKVGESFSVSRTEERITLNDSDDGIIATTLAQAPDIPVRNPDGSYAGPEEAFGRYNPVAMALERDLKLRRTRAIGNIYAEATILKNLKFRSELGTDIQFNNNYGFHPTYIWGSVVNTQNQTRRQFNNSFFWILKNYLTYNDVIAEKHNISVMAGQEAQESTWEGLMASRKNFVSNAIQEINAGDATTATNEGYRGSNALVSYFGRMYYNYDGRYHLTATLRADGSSKFGPDSRWGYFPSFAAAWTVSNESFLKDVGLINNLKLRLGYGMVGNQDIGDYSYGSSLRTVISGLGSGFLLTNIPNPLVQWESTEQKNLGVDLALLSNRISLTFDMYDKQTKDMLIVLPLPNYMGGGSWMGIESPWVNMGELENKGFELSLTTHNLSGQLKWTTDLTFSRNINKVKALGDENAVIYRNVQWFNTVTKTMVGQPLGQFYGFQVAGMYNNYQDILNNPKQNTKIDPSAGVWPGDLIFVNNDKTSTTTTRYSAEDQIDQVIDDNDRVFIGDPNPDFSFGLNNTFSFKSFELNVYMQGTYGNEIFNFTRRQTEGMRSAYNNQIKTVADRARLGLVDPLGDPDDVSNVVVTNPGGDMPRAVPTDPNSNTRISDRYVEDGSYLRIKNVSLAYTLPETLTQKVAVSRLKVYGSIQNLYTFTKYSGYDPEVGAYNQDPLLMGVDNGRYPLPRIFTMGAVIDF